MFYYYLVVFYFYNKVVEIIDLKERDIYFSYGFRSFSLRLFNFVVLRFKMIIFYGGSVW